MTTPSFGTLTGSLVDFAKAIQATLEGNLPALAYAGQPARVWYGEQERYPTVPAYAVEPVVKARTPEGLRRVYRVDLTAQIICYLAVVTATDQVLREEVDRLGEIVENVLHADHTLGGLVLDLVVSSLESGYAYKEDTKYKAVILTVEGRSKQGLPC
jgi:hypothetical protein